MKERAWSRNFQFNAGCVRVVVDTWRVVTLAYLTIETINCLHLIIIGESTFINITITLRFCSLCSFGSTSRLVYSVSSQFINVCRLVKIVLKVHGNQRDLWIICMDKLTLSVHRCAAIKKFNLDLTLKRNLRQQSESSTCV